jgi:hypothetical protein
VHPALALAQREQELSERTPGRNGAAGPDADKKKTDKDRPPLPPAGPKNTRFFGVARISPDRYARDLTRLSQEIIQHLAAPAGVDLEIRVEITARKPDGYPDDKVRNVTENARTLKFETYGFEDQ